MFDPLVSNSIYQIYHDKVYQIHFKPQIKSLKYIIKLTFILADPSIDFIV